MRCFIAGPLPADARGMMRLFGYAECQTPGMGITFLRSAHEAKFPRFHASAQDTMGGGMVINVHLDQESMDGTSSHGYVWAYRNPHLDGEAIRYLDIVEKLGRNGMETASIVVEKMSLLGKLFRIM